MKVSGQFSVGQALVSDKGKQVFRLRDLQGQGDLQVTSVKVSPVPVGSGDLVSFSASGSLMKGEYGAYFVADSYTVAVILPAADVAGLAESALSDSPAPAPKK